MYLFHQSRTLDIDLYSLCTVYICAVAMQSVMWWLHSFPGQNLKLWNWNQCDPDPWHLVSICVSPHHAALCEAGIITHNSDISFVKNPELQKWRNLFCWQTCIYRWRREKRYHSNSYEDLGKATWKQSLLLPWSGWARLGKSSVKREEGKMIYKQTWNMLDISMFPCLRCIDYAFKFIVIILFMD